MLKYEIFPTKRFPKKTKKREMERERKRRLIDATVFYVHGKRGTEIDFYEIRNCWETGREGGVHEAGTGAGIAAWQVSRRDTASSL